RQIFFRLLIRGFTSIDLQPSGCDQNFPFSLERLALHAGNASRVLVLRRRKERSHKALRHHVEERSLMVIKRPGKSAGGNNCKVIAYFCVIKNTLVWLDLIIIKDLLRESRNCGFYPSLCRSYGWRLF